MDQYELGKFAQLAVAHKCSVLYFTKDKFSTLGKKLRPEFERLYLSSEMKDCTKLLGKTIGEGSEPKNIVDLVLADYDSAAVRLLDFVNKRATNPQTKGCPIIPTVFLLSSDTNEREAVEHMRGAGGVTRILKHPIDTKDVLYALIDVLNTQKKVEDTFRSLTRKKVISSKYPYLPIFDKGGVEMLEPVAEEKAVNKAFKLSDLESVRSVGTAGSGAGHNEQRIEEIDDVTECSSLLPDFVKAARRQHPELNSPYKQQRLRSEAAEEEDEEERLHAEAVEREAWRYKREEEMSIESSAQLDRPSDFINAEDAAPIADTRFLGSVDPLADAFQYSNSSLDKSSIASMVRKHQRAEELGQQSTMSSSTGGPVTKAQEYLSNKLRPVWEDVKYEPTVHNSNKKATLAEILGMTGPSKSKKEKMAFAHVHDIHPFVNKPPPLIQRPSTVGGLDKRSADNYWRAYKPRKTEAGPKKERDLRALTPTESYLDLRTSDEGGISRSSTAKLFTSSATTSPSNKAGHHASANFDMSHLAQFGMMEATHSGDGAQSSDCPTAHLHRRGSHAGSLGSASNSHHSRDNMSRDAMSRDFNASRDNFGNLGPVLMSPTKAEKKILELANELPPDLQVSTMMDINFSNRKINLGEKEMLLKGLRLESEGDRESALSCYTRAGMHSKDPQISKMLIGNLNYKFGKLIQALHFYTQAVQILSARSGGSTRAVLDEFIAYRNRGIINFRLGDDHTGLLDIEHAVSLMPQDIELRELISLAKRRMGKYHQAIQEATVAKTIRNEKIREEKLQELQRDILRRKKFLRAEKERNRQRSVGGAVVYNESAQFINFANRSSRHASVLAKPIDMALSTDVSVTSSDVQGNAAANLAAFAETAKDDDINARLLQTRGYVLNIDEPNCHNSLRDRVKESRRQVKANVNNDETSSEDTFLRVFKMNNGYKADLFKDIFERPSELQTALLVHPENRTPENVQVITTTLKLFPVLASLSDSKIRDLAKLLEYRALTSKDTIFAQNDQAAAVCFLLTGHVQVKMEKQSAGQTTIDIVIGDVPQYTSFGFTDFLFRNNNPRIMAEVEAVIRPRTKVQARPNTNTLKSGSGHVKREFLGLNTNSIEEGDEELGDNDSSLGGADAAPPLLTMVGRPGVVDRSLAPGMFKTYAIQSMCELLMLRDVDFEKMLLAPALEDLRKRLDAIRSCGIFNEWNLKHHVRLARMGMLKRVRKGETILQQGSKPNYLYIIMKGMCVVQKQPNRTEMLVQKLTVAREKADEFDSKYLFDHKLCDVLKMANLKEEFKAANADQPDVNFTLTDAKRNPDSILRSSYVTVSELERYKLQLEINKLEALIQSAALEDAKELDNDMFNGSRKYPSSTNNNTTSTANNNTSNNGIPVLELKVADIATIQWPKIFGEACVIDPENGRSRGSIVADTACEIFMLHKTQIQTFPVDDTFLSNVKVKAVAYPGDPDVVVSLFRKQGWKRYRAEVLDEIPKDRWPMNESAVREPFRIS